MTEIFTAKTVEEAKALAARRFGKSISEIRFEVLDEGKSGFFGIGRSDAKVRATVVSAPAPAPAAKPEPVVSAVKEKTEEVKETVAAKTEPVVSAIKEKAEEVKETVAAKTEPVVSAVKEKAEEVKETVAAKTEPVVSAVKEKAEEIKEAVDPEDDEAEYSLDNFTLIEDESLLNPKVKIAKDYITSILNAMDVDVTYTIYQNETGAVINIESDNNGTIIGRRGETLDALQYLCSIIANKGDKDYFRITIDCLGYRKKRKETLEHLAAKVAKSVLRTGRSQPLEPMNPYERRVIHSAVSAIEGVTSRSVGEEPYRKIIISSTNPRPNNRRRGGGRNDRSDRGDRRNNNRGRRNNNRETNFERREIDLSTSFEKDYKKPKPEDSMGGGLYGKIEL